MYELFCILAVFACILSIVAISAAIPTFTDLGSAKYSKAMYQMHRPNAYRAIMARRDEMGRFARP